MFTSRLRASGPLRRLVKDERGVSAVEFAMILPVMVALYFGAVEVSQGISAERKLTQATRSVADLVSRVMTINDADMANSLNAAKMVMQPYSSANLAVTVSSIVIDAQGVARVRWKDTFAGRQSVSNDVVSDLPEALKVPGTSLILSEGTYTYTPTIGYVVTGAITLKDKLYMRPRMNNEVGRT